MTDLNKKAWICIQTCKTCYFLLLQKKTFEKEFKKFLNFYKNDFEEDLLSGQLKTFSNDFPRDKNVTIESIISYFQELGKGMQSLLSEVGRVVKLILVVPASNATSEWCFSKMKLIRDYLRSTMTTTKKEPIILWCWEHIRKYLTI